MIESAREFIALCKGKDPEEVERSLRDTAPLSIWIEIIDQYPERQLDVAQNRSIPEEILRILVNSEDPFVRAVIAEKRKIPRDLFSTLARDPDPSVRQKIAGNGNTPAELLDELSRDPDVTVSRVAQFRRSKRL